ncbi:hypothetical protein D9M70_492870 [compost metagenome]
MVADPRADRLGNPLRATAVDLAGVEHLEAHDVVVGGAQADLHRARRVDQALAGGVVEHGAVVDALAVRVRPGVAVRVEVHQRQRAVHLGVGLEQRVADEVVAAQGQQAAAGGEDAVGMRRDAPGGVLRQAVVEVAVAVVDHRQVVEGIELPGPVALPGRLHRGGADRPRAEAAAGAVGGGGVERHAADHQVDAAQVARITAAHEAGDAGVGRLGQGAVEAVAGDRQVAFVHRIGSRAAGTRHPARGVASDKYEVIYSSIDSHRTMEPPCSARSATSICNCCACSSWWWRAAASAPPRASWASASRPSARRWPSWRRAWAFACASAARPAFA